MTLEGLPHALSIFDAILLAKIEQVSGKSIVENRNNRRLVRGERRIGRIGGRSMFLALFLVRFLVTSLFE
ncbi:hypothetical protein DF133_15600 [Burkholderia cenocepacia]|nr:hypothetical protein DF133_15600 [Burkholderia cenocepacia]